jgi:arylsulfatase A-like enzyme
MGLYGGQVRADDRRDPRPNIVLILTDDQDRQLLSQMAAVQRLLVQQGVTFTRYFTASPVCAPSRASILRGQYPHNHLLRVGTPPAGGWPLFRALGRENSTVATWLQSSGYKTAFMGKYINGYGIDQDFEHVPPGWDEWYGEISENLTGGAYTYFELNENGKLKSYTGNDPDNYEADVLRNKAVHFIQRKAEGTQPFFLLISPFAPHGLQVPAVRHANVSIQPTAPRPPSFDETDVSDKHLVIQDTPQLTPSEIAQIDSVYRGRQRVLFAVDEMVEAVVNTLEETGQLSNTYIFYTSDNGFHLGEHRLRPGKRLPYEEDINVPLVVRGPRIKAGSSLSHLSLNIDLAPTFADIADVTPPDFVDGRSLLPVLFGRIPLEQWRKVALIEDWVEARVHVPATAPPDTVDAHYRALRTSNTKYIDWMRYNQEEYYELSQDPYELESQHGTMSATTRAGLQATLEALYTCAGLGCWQADGATTTIHTQVDTVAATVMTCSLSVYPNPASTHLSVRLGLPDATPVRIELVDVLGRRQQVLYAGRPAPGTHEWTFPLATLPGGLYFVYLTGPATPLVRTVVLAH